MQQSARFGIEHYSQLKELCNKKWDYHNAFFFTGTLATTIGYGNLVPKTDNGRIFCLCFCLIGEDSMDISYYMIHIYGPCYMDVSEKMC